jgi:hypothetical protein
MGRRTVEAIAVDKGQAQGTLAERLQNLVGSSVLHPSLGDWAKEVRLLGNVGAHFDPATDVSEAEAAQLITFTRDLLRYLYELPAELRKRRGE